MKAKEYATRYKLNSTQEELGKIAFDMLMETKELIEKRHAKNNPALFAVLDEIDNKWRRFVDLTGNPNINPDGMMKLIEDKMDFAYYPWITYRTEIRYRR